jgi:uncharacterized protein
MSRHMKGMSMQSKTLASAVALVALSAVLSTPGTAWSQNAASQSKKDLVARVLQLQQPGIEQMAAQMAQQPAAQIAGQARQVLQQMPEERRKALEADLNADLKKYVDAAVPLVRDRAIALGPLTIGPLLEERFTEDELRYIISTLESPINRKFQGMAGDMQRAIVERLVADTRPQIDPKVQELQRSVASRLGITEQGGAAPARPPAQRNNPAPAAPR